ncbi:iron complex transport system ATP-binding protein [Streptomyces sp. 1222.5]|uniref:ABC transporter ATP-binding protein n=1 Tax=unclassified Streptomyces TaxID=2593676 RepID=UPI0008992DFF|nr:MULTISPECIES: ABC transporter ATP-binding protein [unclassified Streptomyces]PKW12229.1 iron complex transport system ATP-binding protein [Streptomyces sp. 5112.2]SEB60131.1 iron complex transport system ATP-binding protein [Streptomyces sp. 1222.5]
MKLTVDQLRITLDHRPILHAVSLEARKGDIVGLVGPNGSGKSTLLRAVYRSLRPADGVVAVGGDDVWALSARAAARRTAAVLQDATGTTSGLTVTGIVALGRAPHHGLLGRDGAEDHRAVEDAIDRCGVRPYADRDYASLSGGERQRVLLARALAQQPRLLVLDELTNHLDIRARFELLDLIRTTGVTTLAVLHDLDLAARLCDHVVVLHEGTVVVAGPVLEVLTPEILADVFGVRASAERHADGVVRITYGAQPLAAGKDRRLSEGEDGFDRGAAGGVGVEGERASHSFDAGTM